MNRQILIVLTFIFSIWSAASQERIKVIHKNTPLGLETRKSDSQQTQKKIEYVSLYASDSTKRKNKGVVETNTETSSREKRQKDYKFVQLASRSSLDTLGNDKRILMESSHKKEEQKVERVILLPKNNQ